MINIADLSQHKCGGLEISEMRLSRTGCHSVCDTGCWGKMGIAIGRRP
jgi:hypothetical protein